MESCAHRGSKVRLKPPTWNDRCEEGDKRDQCCGLERTGNETETQTERNGHIVMFSSPVSALESENDIT